MGASVSVLSYATYQDLQRRGSMEPLQPSSVKLKSYTVDAIPVIECVTLQARYCSGNVVSVLVQVVDGDGPNLLGRDWLIELEVDLGSVQVNTMRNTSGLDEVLDKHSTVFGADLGCMKGQKVKFHVGDSVPPKFHKPRNCTFYAKGKN